MELESLVSGKPDLGKKAKAYLILGKYKLTLFVAISATFGYAMAAGTAFSWLHLGIITLAGFLITSGANALNQVFEREWDAMMKRTQNRPIPRGVLSIREGVIFGVLSGVTGIGLIGYFFNLPAALLGIIGYLSYSFVYTPLKRISPFSVLIGAIPGALPPLIGYTGVTGTIDTEGLILFAFQFFWQFPHFWAIAWVAHEDYSRAGFKMLPSAAGKTQFSVTVIMYYTLITIPLALLPYLTGMITIWQTLALSLAGLYFFVPAWKLFKTQEDTAARKLMFASFWYLPVIQLTFLINIWL
ncbi:MAG: heme o synthase [Bacteroidia bacterium]|nr:heme o synthase [Bacteroidia bacterium]